MKSVYYLQADEIDHLTIRYTDFGEPLNKERAAKFITEYSAWYEDVRNALGGTELRKNELLNMDEKELYRLLVIIRTVLLDRVFDK